MYTCSHNRRIPVGRSIPVYDWSYAQLRDVCPVNCDVAYSGTGEIDQAKPAYVRGILRVEATADNEAKFTHPAFDSEGLLVPYRQLKSQLDRETLIVRVPLGALNEHPDIAFVPPPPPTKPWTCNDVARERRKLESTKQIGRE